MWIPEQADAPKDDRSVFLLAAWHELFHGFTPDSYQPRLHNCASLVDELVDLGGRCASESRYWPQVKKIQAELAMTVRDEERFLSETPDYLSRLNLLISAKTPQSLVSGGKILQTQRDRYWLTFEEIAKASARDLPKRKGEALGCVRRLATFAFQQGKEDDDLWDPITKSADRDPSEVLQEMIDLTQESEKQFTCTLSILGEVDGMHSIARRKGYKIVSASSLPSSYRDEIPTLGSQVLHVQAAVPGRSIRGAVASARKRLGVDMGFVSLYTNPASLRLHTKALVSYHGEDRVFVQTEQAFRRLCPRSNAKRDIANAIDLLDGNPLDRRVLAAVEQLALASASTDTRTRLLNLWSSLETLAGSHEGETALERICDLVVPLVVSRHVHRTTRYLTILTQRYGEQIGSRNFGSGFRKNKKDVAQQDDMLLTLVSKCGAPRIKDLLRFAEHPLLRFRIYSVWQTYHNPKLLHDKLLTSKQRVEWQLARIYRARNLLVHQGEEMPHLVPLLDNLQNYLSMLVQRIIHELKFNPGWGIRDLIEYWNGRMSHSLRCLNACPSVLTTHDFLERGSREPLWP